MYLPTRGLKCEIQSKVSSDSEDESDYSSPRDIEVEENDSSDSEEESVAAFLKRRRIEEEEQEEEEQDEEEQEEEQRHNKSGKRRSKRTFQCQGDAPIDYVSGDFEDPEYVAPDDPPRLTKEQQDLAVLLLQDDRQDDRADPNEPLLSTNNPTTSISTTSVQCSTSAMFTKSKFFETLLCMYIVWFS